MAVAILLGHAIAGKSKRDSFSQLVDALAGLVGCAAVIISTGLSVGDSRDAPSVLVDEGQWKSFLHFIWSHPLAMFIIGSVLGAVAARLLRQMAWARTRRATTETRWKLSMLAFLVTHRRALHIAAVVGCILTSIYAIDGLVSRSGSTTAFLVLAIGAIALKVFAEQTASRDATSNRDWMAVPSSIRVVLRWAVTVTDVMLMGFAIAVLANLLGIAPSWLATQPTRSVPPFAGTAFRAVASGSIAALYALEALFFRYGELRPLQGEALQPN
jgi:hypothetical protein